MLRLRKIRQYAECVVRFKDSTIKGAHEHLRPLIDNDGGHGMLFRRGDALYLTYHTPNTVGSERPALIDLTDNGDSVSKK